MTLPGGGSRIGGAQEPSGVLCGQTCKASELRVAGKTFLGTKNCSTSCTRLRVSMFPLKVFRTAFKEKPIVEYDLAGGREVGRRGSHQVLCVAKRAEDRSFELCAAGKTVVGDQKTV